MINALHSNIRMLSYNKKIYHSRFTVVQQVPHIRGQRIVVGIFLRLRPRSHYNVGNYSRPGRSQWSDFRVQHSPPSKFQ